MIDYTKFRTVNSGLKIICAAGESFRFDGKSLEIIKPNKTHTTFGLSSGIVTLLPVGRKWLDNPEIQSDVHPLCACFSISFREYYRAVNIVSAWVPIIPGALCVGVNSVSRCDCLSCALFGR